MSRGGPDRDWSIANLIHRELDDGCCVVCGKPGADLAHIIGRECDKRPPVVWDEEARGRPWRPYLVVPERVTLLCGPSRDTGTHHCLYDGTPEERRQLNLLIYLSVEQQIQALADAGNVYAMLTRVAGTHEPPAPPVRPQDVRLPRELF